MANRILADGRNVTLGADQWAGDRIIFTGTSPAMGQTPSVRFLGNDTIGSVVIAGTFQLPEYGALALAPAVSVSLNGIALSHGTLGISERPYAALTLTGTSTIANNSTLTATAYSGVGSVTVNGVVDIDGTSTVNLDYMPVAGKGTFHLHGENALLRMGDAGADTVVKLDGGVLSLRDGMHFLGSITDSSPAQGAISPFAAVEIYNAMDAVREELHTSTGMLELFNAQGARVAGLHFAGTGELYAVKTSGLPTDHVVISTHPSADALPLTLLS